MNRRVPFLVPMTVAALIATASLAAIAAVPRAGATSAQTDSTQPSSAAPTLRSSRTATGTGPGTGTGSGSGAATTTPDSADTSSAGTTRVTPADRSGWPLTPRPHILRRFEPPQSQWSRGHRGVDLLAAVGQPVLSAGAGVVAFSGMVAGRGVMTVRHSDGLRTSYEPVDERLASGTAVHRGTKIGVVSAAKGHCVPRTCLHWGAISGRTYRDPLSLLGALAPAVLLPLG